jgi:2',3'-cyclic-nucleotide 2'-phosphodiesterase (5'-nucleotidase family)
MKKNKSAVLFLIAIALLSAACNSSYQPQSLSYKKYNVSDSLQSDTKVLNLIRPYSDSVNKSMNDVIGIAEKDLEKKQPEGSLGNFMVDAFLVMAKEKYNKPVDAAFLNHGGIRLNQLPAGNVTRSKIFELMPFDNLLILQQLKGSVVQQFLDFTASKGGWPVAGITMQIKGGKAVNVMIGGKPLDPNATYTTANSDFLANGGDNADMLRPIPQEANGYLMRDAILDYIVRLKTVGKNINANVENRVTHAQ